MLVLSRKVGESITIDGHIKVKVIAVRGNRIRLGFEAPEFCQIRRSEWLELPGNDEESEMVLAVPPDALYPE
ncbi:MAG: carbon storage regulator [Planctomycetaceae bacterium]|nr:carbon storage regulator [Planctomycetaceae bacterium]